MWEAQRIRAWAQARLANVADIATIFPDSTKTVWKKAAQLWDSFVLALGTMFMAATDQFRAWAPFSYFIGAPGLLALARLARPLLFPRPASNVVASGLLVPNLALDAPIVSQIGDSEFSEILTRLDKAESGTIRNNGKIFEIQRGFIDRIPQGEEEQKNFQEQVSKSIDSLAVRIDSITEASSRDSVRLNAAEDYLDHLRKAVIARSLEIVVTDAIDRLKLIKEKMPANDIPLSDQQEFLEEVERFVADLNDRSRFWPRSGWMPYEATIDTAKSRSQKEVDESEHEIKAKPSDFDKMKRRMFANHILSDTEAYLRHVKTKYIAQQKDYFFK